MTAISLNCQFQTLFPSSYSSSQFFANPSIPFSIYRSSLIMSSFPAQIHKETLISPPPCSVKQKYDNDPDTFVINPPEVSVSVSEPDDEEEEEDEEICNAHVSDELMISRENDAVTEDLGGVSRSRLVARRPVMDVKRSEVGGGRGVEVGDESVVRNSFYEIKRGFELVEEARVGGRNDQVLQRPLSINLELGLYRAKILARNFRVEEAKRLLKQCMYFWPEDGRPYVALGRLLRKQSSISEARSVYERGCQATQGENSYVWQCWAVLEDKLGNVRRARELFDAATVADKKHAAAWHGWAMLEIKQGNLKKARNLLGKGLRYCGPSEYIYQTLALLEVGGKRFDQARYLFQKATSHNPKSCASWLAWAQLEMQLDNAAAARDLFERAVQASPKNRFSWHVWALFEANQENVDKGRKLLKIGHALNPKDPVLLQSLALLEYKHSSANLARVIFKKASDLDPKHQPVWTAWAWMEWKEGDITKARNLYERSLSINTSNENAARCLQAWGVLEQKAGNLTAARRLLRASLNINSQNYITWMTWAQLEEQQGNSVRAEEIRNLYFQQRTEVVDDASWFTGFLDLIDPALDSIKRLLKLDQDWESDPKISEKRSLDKAGISGSSNEAGTSSSTFDLDAFIRDKLRLDASKLDILLNDESRSYLNQSPTITRKVWRARDRYPRTSTTSSGTSSKNRTLSPRKQLAGRVTETMSFQVYNASN